MMRSELEFKLAHPGDGRLLTRMAIDSKSFWGYPEDIMRIWEPELQIDEAYIKQNIVYKILIKDELIGFYALRFLDVQNCFEIDHLWLKPSHIHQGFGRTVFIRILSYLKELGQTKTLLKCDSYSSGFYLKMKGHLKGQEESKIEGRYLTVYEFDVKEIAEMASLESLNN